MRELILRLNKKMNITVLISSHILDELARVATHFGFVDGGTIVKEISAAELADACRSCLRITVSDINVLSRVLDSKGYGIQYIVRQHRGHIRKCFDNRFNAVSCRPGV